MTVESVRPESRRLSPAKRRLLEQRLRGAATGADRIPVRGDQPVADLAPAQHGLWVIDQLLSDNTTYGMYRELWLTGPLDRAALCAGVTDLVYRHEILRTTYELRDRPVQRVRPVDPAVVDTVDLSVVADAEQAAAAVLAEHRRRPFDLATGPLFRALLITLGPARHVLLLAMHHILADQWSMDILGRELAELYRSRCAGTAPRLVPVEVHYADYATWQNRRLDAGLREQQLAYWCTTLADVPPVLELVTDHERPAERSHRGGVVSHPLPAPLTARITGLARARGVREPTVLLAAYATLLHRYSRQQRFAVGSLLSGRTHTDTEAMVGLFATMVAIPLDFGADPGFAEVLAATNQHVLGAMNHPDVTFEQLVADLNLTRDAARNPLFQVLYQHVDAADAALSLPGLEVRERHADSEDAKVDLTLHSVRRGTALSLEFCYATDLFRRETVESFARCLEYVLEQVTADPGRPVGDLDLVRPAERPALFGGVQHGGPATCLAELIDVQVRRRPGETAVVDADGELTYAELDLRAGAVAGALRAAGAGPGTRVGVCLPHTADLVIGLVGVLRSGAAFVALDPEQPTPRLDSMIADARPALLLCDNDAAARLDPGIRRLLLDTALDSAPDTAACPAGPRAGLDDVAYIAFSSGSTGRPKGSQVTQRALANQMVAIQRLVDFSAGETMPGLATVSFDPSFVELFMPLMSGGRVAMIPRDVVADGALLADALAAHGADVVQATPSTWRLLLAAGWCGGPRLRLLCGGEAMDSDLANALTARAGTVFNVYGPTETTVWATAHLVTGGTDRVPVGHALDNMRVYVLDEAMRPVPDGAVGEIHIGGIGMAHGYAGRPDLTATAFLPHPYGAPGERVYRTGDIGRRRADGAVECLGRADHQVKIRGHRIEPGEIESALRGHGDIAHAAVVAHGAWERLRLVGYVAPTPGTTVTASALRAHLRHLLPEYMVPAQIVVLDEMPFTPSRKIDRRALPEPADTRPDGLDDYIAPRTPTERLLADAWQDVLGVDQVGVRDNFFDLGGDSMMSIHIMATARESGLPLTARDLQTNQTIEELAALLQRRGDTAPSTEIVDDSADIDFTGATDLDPDDVMEVYPATALQAGMLFHSLAGEQGEYVQQLAMDIDGPLDVAAFEAAWRHQVDRHAALRSQFLWEDRRRPLVVVRRAFWPDFRRVDLSELADGERMAAAERLVAAEAGVGFDLAAHPPLRFLLVRLGPARHRFVWFVHHLLVDGWSLQLILGDVFRAYQARCTGAPLTEESPVSPRAAAAWSVRHEAGVEEYWRPIVSDVDHQTSLPTGQPSDGPVDTRSVSAVLPGELTEQLRGRARELRTTVSTLVHAAWALLLHRHSGDRSVLFGTTVAGRSAPVPGIERMVGNLINTLALRVDMPDTAPLSAWVAALDTRLAELRDQEHAALGQVQRLTRLPANQQLFESVVVFENFRRAAGGAPPELELRDRSRPSRTGYPLVLESNLHEQLRVAVNFRTDRYDEESASALLRQYEHLLGQLGAAATDTPVGWLSMTGAADRRLLATTTNDTAMPLPERRCLHQLFAEQAARTPDAAAITGVDGAITTYAQLDARANQLAHALLARGVEPETLVGVCLDHSVEMFVALLGIMKAGGAYVPLDPEHPADRLGYILADTRIRLVITRTGLADTIPAGYSGEQLSLDHENELAGLPEDDPGVYGDPDGLVYVLYTSGSTGRPKGVLIPHVGLVNYLWWAINGYGTEGERGAPMLGSIAFDLSVPNFFLPLISGKDVTLLPADRSLTSLAELLTRPGDFSLLKITPGHLDVLRGMVEAGSVHSVRTFVVGADEVRPETVARWREAAPEARIINEYGPTETVVGCSVRVIGADFDPEQPVTIGKPIGNMRMYVLDGHGNLVPPGVVGELYIAGVGVGRGYLNLPALTAEKFVPDPYGAPGERMYRTGDMARLLPDGDFAFLGRTDHQVKVRGYRIELGEVEAHLLAHPAVTEAVVVARTDSGTKRLVAYIVAGGTETTMPDEVRAFLRGRLPDYMVPATVVRLDEMPLSQGGKVDRTALPAPVRPVPDAPGDIDAEPVGELERALAEIWAAVLGRSRVGVADDFFELGGDSMHSIQVVSRARRAGIAVTPRQVFAHTTVRELARAVIEAAGSAANELPPAARGREDAAGDAPLTPVQHWFTELSVDHNHYNRSMVLRCRTVLSPELLDQALRAVVDKHDALRLRLVRGPGGWRQHTVSGETAPLLREVVPGEDEDEFHAAAQRAHRSLDLASGPLLAAVLARPAADSSDNEDRLLVVVHHLAVDTVSLPILIEDLNAACEALAAGSPVRLSTGTASFRSWSRRLSRHAHEAGSGAAARHWHEPVPVSALPVDLVGGTNREGDVRSIEVVADTATTATLLRRPSGSATIDEVLLSALAMTLRDWTGVPTPVVDLESHGRAPLFDEVDVSASVGWFTVLRPVALPLPDSGRDPATCLSAVSAALRAEPDGGREYGIARYLRGDERVAVGRPNAPISFNYHGQLTTGGNDDEAILVRLPYSLGDDRDPNGVRPYQLEVEAAAVDGRLHVEWRYSTACHRPWTIEKLATTFLDYLAAVLRAGAAAARPVRGSASGMSAAMAAALRSARAAVPVPGYSAALVRSGEVVETWCDGVVVAGTAAEIITSTRFQAGSASKHITALAVLRLVREGVLDLDCDIAGYLSAWHLPSGGFRTPITVRHLLSHTAGLETVHYQGVPLGTALPTLDDVLCGRTGTPAVTRVADAGSGYSYSGSGYSVLEQLLVDVTGESFPRLMRRLVFAPLGLATTGYRVAPGRDGGPAQAHDSAGRPYVEGWREFRELAAAGLWTTPTDLGRVQADLYAAVTGRTDAVLSPALARAMVTPVASGYGLGCATMGSGSRTWYGHAGNTPGYGCFLATGRATGDAFVVMANSDAAGDFAAEVLAGLGPHGPGGT